MVTISVELFFQILNTILWIFIIFIGYKLICYISDFLSRLCFNLVLKIDIFIHLGYNRDILMFRRL